MHMYGVMFRMLFRIFTSSYTLKSNDIQHFFLIINSLFRCVCACECEFISAYRKIRLGVEFLQMSVPVLKWFSNLLIHMTQSTR